MSWSGERARQIAEKVEKLIRVVLRVETFFSPKDIHSGEDFVEAINANLEECAFCVVVFTRENLSAPWVIWEAAAFAARGKPFCPLMCDLSFSEIPGPLRPRQAREFKEQQVRELCHDIARVVFGPEHESRESELINDGFQGQWPSTHRYVKALLEKPTPRPDDLPPTLRRLERRWHDLHVTQPGPDDADFNMYLLCGFEVGSSSSTIVKNASPREQLYYQWADPDFDDRIAVARLKVPDASEYPGFRVEFQTNDVDSHPPNIAIRPNGRVRLSRGPSEDPFREFSFSIRIPAIPGRTSGCEVEDPNRFADGVEVAIRVIDGMKTHWEFNRNHRPDFRRCEEVGVWKPVRFILQDDNDRHTKWEPFPDDGNFHYRFKDPDFSTILAVVISFRPLWKYRGGNLQPMPGQGVLDVANFEVL